MMRFLYALFILFSAWPLSAFERPAIVSEDANLHLPVSAVYQYRQFLDKVPAAADIPQLVALQEEWQISKSTLTQYGKYFASLVPIENKSSHPVKVIARANVSMGSCCAYLLSDNALTVPPTIFNRFPSYELLLNPGTSYLVMFHTINFTGTTRLHFELLGAEYAQKKMSIEDHLQGLVFGMVGIMIIYNVGLGIFFRKKYFFYYAGYAGFYLAFLAMAGGYVAWSSNFNVICALGSMLSLICFNAYTFDIRERHPINYRFSLAFATFACFAGIHGFFTKKAELIFIILLAVPILSLIASIQSLRVGDRSARFFVAGWTAFLLGNVGTLLNTIFWGNELLNWTAVFGFCAEVCLFSFAIGQKVRLSEEKFHNESKHAFSQLEKVVYPHQLQRMKSGSDLESTMPTFVSEAFVISFDIIASTKIRHENVKEFLRQIFRRCNEAMMEGYNPASMRANAYRIKEMGDGFLCSVGYPFQSKTGDVAKDTLDLAKRFHLIFTEEVQNLGYHESIACGIGIASGELAGFYPVSGTKEYDLYGAAIVLATRYEQMRKVIFEGQPPGSILILQERVFTGLNSLSRQGFMEYDLKRNGVVVRDDAGAVKLYYRMLDGKAHQRSLADSA
ncbi:MAG TPA: 7TM diverse intracellular signaling domain-containing protein [Oligoflexus sp.]|uniref:7TM diverse intracellular signaling domain-containing protein n=1 Tax=Oligoflexus sp. TaxID=1971216 RepID=UPI002D577063|nr:7TM diverse intracellular signaling domain-containing protein [Oligoflexus sp.]HYX36188.1 7TM diverse intracellular signaling domain-containing protein [Oligoflexus sp.]